MAHFLKSYKGTQRRPTAWGRRERSSQNDAVFGLMDLENVLIDQNQKRRSLPILRVNGPITTW